MMRQWLKIVSTVFLTIIYIYNRGRKDIFGVVITWICIMYVVNYARKIPTANIITHVIRMSWYFMFFLLPIVFDYGNIENYVLKGNYKRILLISAVVFVVINMLRRKQWEIMCAEFSIANLSFATRRSCWLRIFCYIGSAICEEIFFRIYMICMFDNKILGVFVSILYFMLAHYLLEWGDSFKKRDFLNQFVYGGLMGGIFVYCESVLPCIIVHICINSYNICIEYLRYVRFYVNKEKYDSILELDDEIDIDF